MNDAVLHIAARTWIDTDERLAPAGRRPVAGSTLEFDGSSPLGTASVDNAFTDLERHPDGGVEASMTQPTGAPPSSGATPVSAGGSCSPVTPCRIGGGEPPSPSSP